MCVFTLIVFLKQKVPNYNSTRKVTLRHLRFIGSYLSLMSIKFAYTSEMQLTWNEVTEFCVVYPKDVRLIIAYLQGNWHLSTQRVERYLEGRIKWYHC